MSDNTNLYPVHPHDICVKLSQLNAGENKLLAVKLGWDVKYLLLEFWENNKIYLAIDVNFDTRQTGLYTLYLDCDTDENINIKIYTDIFLNILGDTINYKLEDILNIYSKLKHVFSLLHEDI